MRFTSYDSSLRNDLVSLWNICLGERFPMEERLLVQNLEEDPNFDPDGAFACREGGDLAAFASARVCRVPLGKAGFKPGEGWISFVLVHPEYRRKALGRIVVECALAFLKSHRARRIYAGGDPGHFFPGVPEESPGAVSFFERCGFTALGEAHDFIGRLDSLPRIDRLEKLLEDPAVSVEPLGREEIDDFLSFMRDHFGGRWLYEMERKIGIEPGPDFLFILKVDGRFAGFANTGDEGSRFLSPGLYWRGLLRRPSGCLGPIGVAPDLRGKGLGLVLLYGSLEAMRDRGIQDVVIDWTVLDDFYGKLGLQRWKSYRMMRLDLPS
jgi:GNAT superfamily N-acetyltransferase